MCVCVYVCMCVCVCVRVPELGRLAAQNRAGRTGWAGLGLRFRQNAPARIASWVIERMPSHRKHDESFTQWPNSLKSNLAASHLVAADTVVR